MQSYYQQRVPPGGEGGSGSSYPQGYPQAPPTGSLHPATAAAAAAAAARMQWSPNMHPSSQWTYDFYHHQQVAAAAAASYHQQQQQGSGGGSEGQQPATSPTDHNPAATPHNIRDILGVQQPPETLVSEVAKTPSYQKSPTSAAAVAGTVFHYPSPAHPQDLVRSPTTPNPDPMTAPSFYLPAVPAGRPFGE